MALFVFLQVSNSDIWSVAVSPRGFNSPNEIVVLQVKGELVGQEGFQEDRQEDCPQEGWQEGCQENCPQEGRYQEGRQEVSLIIL